MASIFVPSESFMEAHIVAKYTPLKFQLCCVFFCRLRVVRNVGLRQPVMASAYTGF